MNKEIRNLTNSEAEIRAIKDSRRVDGYGIVFNSESRDLGGFSEIISPDSLNGIIENKGTDILALLNHNEDRGLLARYRNGGGTLSLTVDEKGLKYAFDSPNTNLGDEVLEGINRGDISTSSFAFRVAPNGEKWEKRDDGSYLRTITAFADIFDVSPVYKEAYSDTTVAKRSMAELRKEEIPPEVKEPVEPPVEKKSSFKDLTEHYAELEKQINELNK